MSSCRTETSPSSVRFRFPCSLVESAINSPDCQHQQLHSKQLHHREWCQHADCGTRSVVKRERVRVWTHSFIFSFISLCVTELRSCNCSHGQQVAAQPLPPLPSLPRPSAEPLYINISDSDLKWVIIGNNNTMCTRDWGNSRGTKILQLFLKRQQGGSSPWTGPF